MPELILALELLTLLCAARAQWERVRTDEDATLNALLNGDGRCDWCGGHATQWTVVDAALYCLACAEIIRPRGAPCA